MIQLAIDPATKFMAYSVIDTFLTIGHDVVKYGLIRVDDNGEVGNVECDSKYCRPQIHFSDKLLLAYNNCVGLINQYHPDVIPLEDQYYNVKTPMIKDVIRITGVIILAAKQNGIPVVMYPPQVIKLAIAKKGKAIKEAVAKAVSEIYKDDKYVSLLEFSTKQTKAKDKTDDIFDSIALNLTHRYTRNGAQI